MIFIYSAISSGLEFCSVNNTLAFENYELKAFRKINFFDETSNNWPNDLLGKNVYKTLESCW